jgi:hypothetical protein
MVLMGLVKNMMNVIVVAKGRMVFRVIAYLVIARGIVIQIYV